MVKGLLAVFGTFVASIVIGVMVAVLVLVVTDNEEMATACGTGAWILSGATLWVYAGLWLGETSAVAPNAPLTMQSFQSTKYESQLKTAEFRLGFVYVMIGGAAAQNMKASMLVTTLVMICCAMVGALFGHDIKRRVYRMRERKIAESNAEHR